MKWIYIILITTLFTGCDLLDEFMQKDKSANQIMQEKMKFEKKVALEKEVQLKKLSEETQRELALLETKKELAKIEKEKELEKIRMQSELEKQKIIFAQEKQKALFEQQMIQNQQMNNMELKRYIMAIGAVLLFLISFFLYYYFSKKRQDKLMAYNDNLKKYFHHKENEARVQIANKMLDAISSGKLDKAQENQLIGAFSGEVQGSYQKQLSHKDEEMQEIEVEFIEAESSILKK
ncbi:MAG: hypothetical protein GXO30_08480 [Epsilonproteobacteria bacterium]|nr:hypothetical protein [Campylobacterota bacterium]